jgi:hypothetical protein
MFVAVLGGTVVAREQALARSLSALPESARAFRVDRFGLPLDPSAYKAVDRRARRALQVLGGGRTRRVILFRELRVQGERVEIAAVDDLPELVHMRAGRLPRSCTPSECEVLQIGGGGAARLAEGDVRLRRVGIAQLRDRELFGEVSAAAAGAASPPKLLLARDVRALQELDSLSSFYRIYSWVSPLRVNGLHAWDVDAVLAKESRVQAALAADSAFRLGGPDAALLDAQERGRTAGRRLLLVGGETSTLLLGFAIAAAIGLRRGLASERRRLFARGASRWQVALVSYGEVAAMTLAGAIVGLAVGTTVAAVIAGLADLPAGAAVRHAVVSESTVLTLVAAWAAATLLLALTTLSRDTNDGRRVLLIDVAAAGAVATVAVAASRGALDPASSSTGDTVLFLILPALVAFVAAVLLARLLAPAMRAAERLTRTRSVSVRLAVLALARAPARTVLSCAFVTVALGLALFAASYRATLSKGAADQAAFEVPLDFTVTEGSQLVRPLDAAHLERYRRLGGSADAYPVLRLAATTSGRGASVLSPTVLGIPAPAVAKLRWRSDFSSLPAQALAERLAPTRAPRLTRIPLPAATTRLTVAAGVHGSDVEVGLVVDRPDGRLEVLRFGGLHEGTATLAAGVTTATHPHVVGLQLALPTTEQFFLAHRETEGSVNAAPTGVLELGPLRAQLAGGGERVVTDWRGWSLGTGGHVTRRSSSADVTFVFQDTGGHLVFRPAEATDGKPIPLVVSPDIARVVGAGTTVTIDFQSLTLSGHVVGVAGRMPTVTNASTPFVLADERWLSTAIDAAAPGQGTPNEVWIATADGQAAAAALRRPPFSKLVISSRTALERELETDPLAHATGVALGAAAVVALALALLGFWLGVAGELRDERSDFFDLEAQGLPPEGLRAQLRMRAGILVAVALAAGVGLGAILSQFVVSLVRISATNVVPQPPLQLDTPTLTVGVATLALAALAFVIVEGSAAAAFRSARPEQASWSLE